MVPCHPEFQSSASGPTKTEAAIGVVNSTPTNGTAVVRFYFLDGSTYLLIGETASFTVFGNDDYMAVALSMDFTFVAGTYAARLFLNGSTATYVDMKSANFAPV